MKTYLSLHLWHRRIGIIAALFVILLVITGMLLNHTDKLELEHHFVGNTILLDWYNIAPPSEPTSYATKNHRLSLLGQRLFIDQQEIAGEVEELLGALELDDLLIVAINEALLVVDQQGQLVEKLSSAEGVPAGMKKLGRNNNNLLVIEAAHGEYLVDIEELNWQEKPVPDAIWSEASPLPDVLKTTLFEAYRGKGLSLERVLLDLHSGRILGTLGVYIIDIAAILFLLLAVTGIWMWSRR